MPTATDELISLAPQVLRPFSAGVKASEPRQLQRCPRKVLGRPSLSLKRQLAFLFPHLTAAGAQLAHLLTPLRD